MAKANVFPESFQRQEKKTVLRSPDEIYLFEPMSQKTEPKISALNVVKKILTALYCGLLQYTRFCFHRQVKN